MRKSADSQLYLEIREHTRPAQSLAAIGLDDASLLDALAQFDLYGAWRLDLETGMVFWTPDVFEIHGLPYREGPVDLGQAIARYHPEDREMVANCIEEAATRKSGFRFVLRLTTPDGRSKLVKSSGRYRVNKQGGEEIYGTFSQFQERIRTVAVNS
ncbi:PAS domain-containing protein [Oricola sp.]|uniref:PAS domain-containing protein n=1 Tax=Oricola sp. TaxID=1979950 RepID=UPI0025F35189|nr:PAS domain-containing protein [Oricola sp.]MCI5073579.1 PAS domain-containing protein [Oricola sp.]